MIEKSNVCPPRNDEIVEAHLINLLIDSNLGLLSCSSIHIYLKASIGASEEEVENAIWDLSAEGYLDNNDEEVVRLLHH